MRIPYTELEQEKKMRIEAQLALLQEQANRLVAERDQLFNSILKRGGVALDGKGKAIFGVDAVKIEDSGMADAEESGSS